jgi:uncharacterized RDD family membrane protein YckC
MAKEEKKGTTGPESRFVWDPDKMTWVERVKEPPRGKPLMQQEPVAESLGLEVIQEEEALPEGAEGFEEAVPMEYRGALSRVAAIIVDLIILTIISAIIGLIVTRTINPPSWAQRPTEVGVGFVYFVGFWAWRGQTPGKMLLGARIVKADGGSIGIARAILRYIVYLIPAFVPVYLVASLLVEDYWAVIVTIAAVANLAVVAFSGSKRGIHDLIAGTYVINSRAYRSTPMEAVEDAEASGTAPDEQQ